jgi:hypothetical protein
MFDSSVLTTFSKMSSVIEKSCSKCLNKSTALVTVEQSIDFIFMTRTVYPSTISWKEISSEKLYISDQLERKIQLYKHSHSNLLQCE